MGVKLKIKAADGLLSLLLAMAEEHTLDGLLARVTQRLAAEPGVALARIWLLRSDRCPICDEPPGAPDLHLVSSAGTPRGPGDWSRLDGDFHRVAVGERKIGEVGAGRLVHVENIGDDDHWIARPSWTRLEGIRGFGGAPLRFQGEVLGALGVFTRRPFDAVSVEWLQVLADHAGAAIAGARAFEEVASVGARLQLENTYLREEVEADGDSMVGSSPAMQAIEERIGLVAKTDARVLVQGESGTGKELVARAIHRRSGRAQRPLIVVNCAAIPRDLYESELFGHTRGAFSGAARAREGRFAAAHEGTLFLDEIGELPLELQAKLLRVLEDGAYQRLGEDRTRQVDVRVLAATNRDLLKAVAAGRFREDLYYRLNVFPIVVPPLRDRVSDIRPLADHLLDRAFLRFGRGVRPSLDESSLSAMEAYPWPGNVRELKNAIERAVITWVAGPLRVDVQPRATPAPRLEGAVLTRPQWQDLERTNLRAALERTGWKVGGPGGAAELLDMNPNTLRSRIARLSIAPVEV